MMAKRGHDRGDLHDGAHFADAAYADFLVSEDRAFHQIVAETGISTKMIKRFSAEWKALLK